MPRGNIDPNFDIAELAKGAGATFVARGSVADPITLKNYIKKGLAHKGMSVIDALSNCHIQWGRRNKYGDPVKLVELIKEKTVSKTKAAKMSKEELEGKYILGILHEDTEKKEYTEAYKELVEKAQNE
jgi:2-oxoglutarate ferredoxin oxidoreductase subunit beta